MRPTFSSKVMGPHFERLCRDWAHWYAAPETFGGYPARIGSGTINDRSARVLHEIDVGVLGQGESGRHEVLCLGEAKWNTVMTPGHVERLARARDFFATTRAPQPATGLAWPCFPEPGSPMSYVRSQPGQLTSCWST